MTRRSLHGSASGRDPTLNFYFVGFCACFERVEASAVRARVDEILIRDLDSAAAHAVRKGGNFSVLGKGCARSAQGVRAARGAARSAASWAPQAPMAPGHSGAH